MRSDPDGLIALGATFLLLILGTVKAIAQAAPTATGPGATIFAGGGGSLFYSPYGQRNLGGAYVFVDVQPHWRVGIEAEARFISLHNSEQVSEQDYLAGPKVLIRSGRCRPYAKFLIGDGHIELPFHYARGDFLALTPGVGLDLEVNDYVSVRAIDIEYQLWRGFPFGSMRPYGISTGMSIRLTRIVRFPKGPRVRS